MLVLNVHFSIHVTPLTPETHGTHEHTLLKQTHAFSFHDTKVRKPTTKVVLRSYGLKSRDDNRVKKNRQGTRAPGRASHSQKETRIDFIPANAVDLYGIQTRRMHQQTSASVPSKCPNVHSNQSNPPSRRNCFRGIRSIIHIFFEKMISFHAQMYSSGAAYLLEHAFGILICSQEKTPIFSPPQVT